MNAYTIVGPTKRKPCSTSASLIRSECFEPAGTPRRVIDKIQREIAKMYADPLIAQKLEKSGISAVSSTPEEFDAFVRKELDRWGQVLKDSGIQLN